MGMLIPGSGRELYIYDNRTFTVYDIMMEILNTQFTFKLGSYVPIS